MRFTTVSLETLQAVCRKSSDYSPRHIFAKDRKLDWLRVIFSQRLVAKFNRFHGHISCRRKLRRHRELERRRFSRFDHQ